MNVSDLFIRRPVFAVVISLMIVLFGLAALNSLPVRELPDVEMPVVTVTTAYTGAAPEVTDTQITTIIEGAVAGIAGVRSIASSSGLGRARTVIEFETSRNIDEAANDVRAAVARVVNELPEDAEEPRITKSDSDASPVMRLSLTSDTMDTAALTDYADRFITDRLATVDGVAEVDIMGERVYAIRVWLDRRAMAARDVTVSDVTAALRANNVELPAGEVVSAKRRFQVRTDTRLDTPEAFAAITIKTSNGYPIRVGDIARVERGVENDDTIVRSGAKGAVTLGVLRQSQANTVRISKAIRAEIAALQPQLPEGMQITVGSDDAVFIQSAIHEVVKALVIAVALVVLVIYGFLASLRGTLVPTVTIPISLLGACWGIALLGYSINILTLFALVLAIGIVVDDAIVVLENIRRRMEQGESRLVASVLGAKQVTFAVIATSLTLMAVFVPISMLQGTVGRLFAEFGVVMAIAVAVSMIVALSLCPMLCSIILPRTTEQGRLERLVERVTKRVNRVYGASLGWALRHPVLVIGVSLAIAAASAALYTALPKELTAREDRGLFIVAITAPQGANLAYTDAATKKVEAILQPLVDSGEALSVTSIVGRGNDPSTALVVVRLTDWDQRQRSQQQIVSTLIPQLAQVTDVRAFPIQLAGLGLRGAGNPVRAVIGGPDFESVKAWAQDMLERARANPGLQNVELDYEENQPEYRVEIDRERARDLGIDIQTVAQTLQALFASQEVTRYIDRGREYPVIVQAGDEDRQTAQDLGASFVRTNSGKLVPLSSFISFRSHAASASLARYDRLPSITLSASLAEGYDLGTAISAIQELANEVLPVSGRLSFAGQSKEYLETSSGANLSFLLAILIVYLVLAAQFESFVHPLTILLSVPLAVTGAFATIWFTGGSLNIYSQVGLVLLVGLMAKNGILIVEFANQLRDEGKSVRDAILEASVVRLRPILMTVIATVLGAVPLAIATGAGAESRSAIGMVIIGGFGIASVLTLYLTPVLYDLMARLTRPRAHVTQQLEAELGGNQRS
ncbi:efflux RND transporter permease subunit [Rhodoligotrophos defluvii]|uniref:efflux RND transporter permease subunit n=1 Tax=Rhodoligotrophos defluvii TaxID=2561934 RepID=UPI0010CA0ACD|nr:efflux RND transporter permease subunit [Rhodoligotrophos defluvii]